MKVEKNHSNKIVCELLQREGHETFQTCVEGGLKFHTVIGRDTNF